LQPPGAGVPKDEEDLDKAARQAAVKARKEREEAERQAAEKLAILKARQRRLEEERRASTKSQDDQEAPEASTSGEASMQEREQPTLAKPEEAPKEVEAQPLLERLPDESQQTYMRRLAALKMRARQEEEARVEAQRQEGARRKLEALEARARAREEEKQRRLSERSAAAAPPATAEHQTSDSVEPQRAEQAKDGDGSAPEEDQAVPPPPAQPVMDPPATPPENEAPPSPLKVPLPANDPFTGSPLIMFGSILPSPLKGLEDGEREEDPHVPTMPPVPANSTESPAQQQPPPPPPPPPVEQQQAPQHNGVPPPPVPQQHTVDQELEDGPCTVVTVSNEDCGIQNFLQASILQEKVKLSLVQGQDGSSIAADAGAMPPPPPPGPPPAPPASSMVLQTPDDSPSKPGRQQAPSPSFYDPSRSFSSLFGAPPRPPPQKLDTPRQYAVQLNGEFNAEASPVQPPPPTGPRQLYDYRSDKMIEVRGPQGRRQGNMDEMQNSQEDPSSQAQSPMQQHRMPSSIMGRDHRDRDTQDHPMAGPPKGKKPAEDYRQKEEMQKKRREQREKKKLMEKQQQQQEARRAAREKERAEEAQRRREARAKERAERGPRTPGVLFRYHHDGQIVNADLPLEEQEAMAAWKKDAAERSKRREADRRKERERKVVEQRKEREALAAQRAEEQREEERAKLKEARRERKKAKRSGAAEADSTDDGGLARESEAGGTTSANADPPPMVAGVVVVDSQEGIDQGDEWGAGENFVEVKSSRTRRQERKEAKEKEEKEAAQRKAAEVAKARQREKKEAREKARAEKESKQKADEVARQKREQEKAEQEQWERDQALAEAQSKALADARAAVAAVPPALATVVRQPSALESAAVLEVGVGGPGRLAQQPLGTSIGSFLGGFGASNGGFSSSVEHLAEKAAAGNGSKFSEAVARPPSRGDREDPTVSAALRPKEEESGPGPQGGASQTQALPLERPRSGTGTPIATVSPTAAPAQAQAGSVEAGQTLTTSAPTETDPSDAAPSVLRASQDSSQAPAVVADTQQGETAPKTQAVESPPAGTAPAVQPPADGAAAEAKKKPKADKAVGTSAVAEGKPESEATGKNPKPREKSVSLSPGTPSFLPSSAGGSALFVPPSVNQLPAQAAQASPYLPSQSHALPHTQHSVTGHTTPPPPTHSHSHLQQPLHTFGSLTAGGLFIPGLSNVPQAASTHLSSLAGTAARIPLAHSHTASAMSHGSTNHRGVAMPAWNAQQAAVQAAAAAAAAPASKLAAGLRSEWTPQQGLTHTPAPRSAPGTNPSGTGTPQGGLQPSSVFGQQTAGVGATAGQDRMHQWAAGAMSLLQGAHNPLLHQGTTAGSERSDLQGVQTFTYMGTGSQNAQGSATARASATALYSAANSLGADVHSLTAAALSYPTHGLHSSAHSAAYAPQDGTAAAQTLFLPSADHQASAAASSQWGVSFAQQPGAAAALAANSLQNFYSLQQHQQTQQVSAGSSPQQQPLTGVQQGVSGSGGGAGTPLLAGVQGFQPRPNGSAAPSVPQSQAQKWESGVAAMGLSSGSGSGVVSQTGVARGVGQLPPAFTPSASTGQQQQQQQALGLMKGNRSQLQLGTNSQSAPSGDQRPSQPQPHPSQSQGWPNLGGFAQSQEAAAASLQIDQDFSKDSASNDFKPKTSQRMDSSGTKDEQKRNMLGRGRGSKPQSSSYSKGAKENSKQHRLKGSPSNKRGAGKGGQTGSQSRRGGGGQSPSKSKQFSQQKSSSSGGKRSEVKQIYVAKKPALADSNSKTAGETASASANQSSH